jgi:hypothetical protein
VLRESAKVADAALDRDEPHIRVSSRDGQHSHYQHFRQSRKTWLNVLRKSFYASQEGWFDGDHNCRAA